MVNSMTNVPEANGRTYELRLITRWVGFLALLTGILYLRVVVIETLAAIRSNDWSLLDLLPMVLLFLATLGLLLAWRWEGLGGLLAFGSGISLGLVDYLVYGPERWVAVLLYCSPFVVAGGLCLICWWRRREATGQPAI
jgi:hypothetical protein